MRRAAAALLLAFASSAPAAAADAPGTHVTLGPRPAFLVSRMPEGALRERLEGCVGRPATRSDFSIGHRGAPLQFPEHTRESYEAAARMGAGIVECDVTFTKDRALVCRHAQCDLHATTDILRVPELAAKCSEPFRPADPAAGTEASARCCASDLTLAEFGRLCGRMEGVDPAARSVDEYLAATPGWRTDLYAGCGTVMSHAESVALFRELGVGLTPELKAPEVPMPFEGAWSQEDFADALVRELEAAEVPPERVWLQSFQLDDVRHWIRAHPAFGRQAVFLDERVEAEGFDTSDPATWSPPMEALAADGLRFVAPPLFALLTLDAAGRMVPSRYAEAARAAGLEILTWTVERSGRLERGGGWYHRSIAPAIRGEGDVFTVLDALARRVGVRGVFSDWPATTTFYASCVGAPFAPEGLEPRPSPRP